MVAREQALDAPAHRHVERAQRALGDGARARARRGRRRQREGDLAHATSVTSSTRGIGHALEHRLDDGLRADALGERAVREHEAVAHGVGRELVHVGGQHVAAAAQHGERARGVQHADRPARADAERDERVKLLEPVAGEVARHGGEPHRIARHGRIDVDRLARPTAATSSCGSSITVCTSTESASARWATVCSSSIAG